MARTIGVKNVNLVKKLTLVEIEKGKGKTNSNDESNIEDRVIEKLPASLWDIWESADSEIRRIIWDKLFEAS